MTDRDEIEKWAKELALIVYPKLGADFFEREEYDWAWPEYIHEFTPLAEHLLTNFVPRTDHERIVGELEKRLDEDYALIVDLQEKLEKYEPRQPACCG